MWKTMVTSAIWTLLFSVLVFYAVDIRTEVYFFTVAAAWGLLLVQYSSYKKNQNLYRQALAISCSNFLAFIFFKWIHGYHFAFDLEDRFCIGYGLLLGVAFVVGRWIARRKTTTAEAKGEVLFRERKFDAERLREYLSVFSVIGINGPWGSGKSFVTDHIGNTGYMPIKIDLLACNLDEIQSVLLNELDKVLKERGIFSPYSPKLKKQLKQGQFVQNVGQLLVRDDVSYTEAVTGFRQDLKKLGKTILIIFEDLDRIDNADVIRKILGISEKLAGDNIKIIYQYDEENLRKKEQKFDRRYLEKYIPFTMSLTEIPFSRILDYWFETETGTNLPLKREDFKFLELPITPPYSVVGNLMSGQIHLMIPNVTVRKVEHFLKEMILFLSKDGIYKKNKREVILFFLIKHFYDELYEKLIPGESLLHVFKFDYQGKKDTLVNWFHHCKKNNVNISDIFLAEENRESALMVSLFEYQCDIDEVERKLENIVNESVTNIQKQNANEQKDRIIWNLLCNGKSEYTNQRIIVDRLQKDVLSKPLKQQEQAFEKLWDDIFYGRCRESEKGDNETIFLLGVPSMLSLFQANRVAGITGEQWIMLIRFYLRYKKVESITPELIECLNYCALGDRKTYLDILREFNQLKVEGNMNSHKAYQTFLDEYLSAFSVLGYVDTHEVRAIRNMVEEEIDAAYVQGAVFEPLKRDLEELKRGIPITAIGEEIDVLLGFLAKNMELVQFDRQLEKPEMKVKTEMRSVLRNQHSIDQLNALKVDDNEFNKRVWEMYEKKEITAYEVAKLERFRKLRGGV